MAELAWLIPLLPLLAWLIITVVGRRFKDQGDKVGIAGMAIALVMSVGVLWDVIHGAHVARSFVWATHGDFEVRFGYQVDPLAATMLFIVSLVSLMVHVYSVGYMHGDSRYKRYYAVLSLFTFAMLGLVLADNFLLLFVFWEIMGLSSYLLIGHYFEEKANIVAANKAFLTTRAGDIGMFIGIMALFTAAGSFDFTTIIDKVHSGQINEYLLAVSVVLVFMGAIGKSAQFPLHVWLPDAMAGPTPASALIHAATMVAAGVFLVARTYGIFEASPVAMTTVAWIGGITALFAASMGLVMEDIKKVLAYSTVSQLGFMMAALGVGGFTAGVFHLVTHATFKSLLFLCSGSVIHAAHTQDMWQMGGLRKKMPITFWTWTIAGAALAGIPPLAGFWSKDEIMLSAWHGNAALFWVLAVAALFTAFYITRATVLTFLGRPRDQHVYGHAHESPGIMTVPLIILAAFAALIGFWNSPITDFAFSKLVFFGHPHEAETSSFVVMIATLSWIIGVGFAVVVYALKIIDHMRVRNALKPLWVLLKNRYYIDDAYWFLFVRGMIGLAMLVGWFDRWIIDGIVNAVGGGARRLSAFTGAFDHYVVDGVVNGVGRVFTLGSQGLRQIQTGLVQSYALALFLTVVVGLVIFAIGG